MVQLCFLKRRDVACVRYCLSARILVLPQVSIASE